jgi:hypothetical protein
MVVAIAATAVAVGASAYSASQQSKAAKDAAKTQAGAADAATALQERMFEQGREDVAPWREAGMRALPQLEQLIRQGPGQPFQGPAALDPRRFAFDARPYQFTPPSPESLANDPGYQFRLRSGQQALEGSAAAKGGLLSGGAMRGLTEFGQQLGSQEYQQAYGRALGENQQAYGRALAGNEQRYGRAYTGNQDQYNRALQAWQSQQGLNQTQYNRLAGLAGVGQQTSQYLGTLGANYASNAGELALQRGNALAAGQIGQANAWGNFANTAANSLGGLGGTYLARPQTPSPQQMGYAPYNMNSQPYNPWEFMGQ